MQLIAGLRERMFRPVDISGLVVFRVLFGLLMAWDTARYVTFGWVSAHYVKPPILLKYIGFQWVAPLPEPLMYGVFGMMIASGIAIALGWYYRLSCAIFCLGHTYAFLLAASYYLNHAYLISVWAALMIFVPAHRTASIDALRAPEIQTRQVHDWYRWLLIGTLTVVYIFGAIAKMNVDWFAGMPTRMWMAHSASEVPIGGDVLRSEFFLWAVTYGGLLYDLFIVPALLWKRTRVIAVILSCGFHLTNAYMFNIGVFPWFMLAATTLFFVPAWPRKLPRKLIGPLLELVDYRLDDDGDQANQRKRKRKKSKQKKAPLGPPALTNRQRTRTLALVSGFLLIMCLIPLRHH